MSFATRLREARKSKELTQQQLAELVGVGHTAISNYEKAITFPNTDILYKIFDVLQIEPNFFFQDDINYTTDENLTPKEKKIIKAYREHPELQVGIDKMLDIKTADKKEADKYNAEFSQDMFKGLTDKVKRDIKRGTLHTK